MLPGIRDKALLKGMLFIDFISQQTQGAQQKNRNRYLYPHILQSYVKKYSIYSIILYMYIYTVKYCIYNTYCIYSNKVHLLPFRKLTSTSADLRNLHRSG